MCKLTLRVLFEILNKGATLHHEDMKLQFNALLILDTLF